MGRRKLPIVSTRVDEATLLTGSAKRVHRSREDMASECEHTVARSKYQRQPHDVRKKAMRERVLVYMKQEAKLFVYIWNGAFSFPANSHACGVQS